VVQQRRGGARGVALRVRRQQAELDQRRQAAQRARHHRLLRVGQRVLHARQHKLGRRHLHAQREAPRAGRAWRELSSDSAYIASV
jgi:hypothetical protein